MLHEDQQYLLKDLELQKAGFLSDEDFRKKLVYYLALEQYYADIRAIKVDGTYKGDSISNNLKIGGNEEIAEQLSKGSLVEFFQAEGINPGQGMSGAIREYAKRYGVTYGNSAEEIAEKVREIKARNSGRY